MNNDIIRMAREAGVSIRGHYDETGSTPQEIERLIALARADEREACVREAEVALSLLNDPVAAIRARGNT